MIDNTREYIAMPAIYFNDGRKHPLQESYGINVGYVVAGFRHPYIFGAIGIPENEEGTINPVYGFVTSYGRFVDRHKAVPIAISSGQCKEEDINRSSGLFSEDIFKYQVYCSDNDGEF